MYEKVSCNSCPFGFAVILYDSGRQVRFGTGGWYRPEPDTMDPAMYQDLASSQVMRNIFETLVAYTSDVQEIKPLIAESWTVSDDLKVWTFKLRENVFFQKGKFRTVVTLLLKT